MPKHPRSIFGLRLRSARERAGLAQDRLGVLIGLDESCSSARISRYETGVHQPPFEVAERLASVLNIPTAYLYCAQDAEAEVLIELSDLLADELAVVLKYIRTIRKRRK